MEAIYSAQSAIDCQQENAKFLGLQFGLKSLPGVLLLIIGTFRYLQIRHMAKSNVTYSLNFKIKVGLSGGMAFLTIIYFFVVFFSSPNGKLAGYVASCDKKPFEVLYLVQCAAWTFGTCLMIAEYHRLLDEAKFANPVFWILNLLVEVICVIVLHSVIWSTTIMTFTALFNLLVNFTLVVLMCWTTKHNLRYRTPLIIDYPDESHRPVSRVTQMQGQIAFKT